jgi:hypothetical protein
MQADEDKAAKAHSSESEWEDDEHGFWFEEESATSQCGIKGCKVRLLPSLWQDANTRLSQEQPLPNLHQGDESRYRIMCLIGHGIIRLG